MFGCCGCELTLLSDHFIVHRNELFLTVDIENDACVPPGVIGSFLDCHFEKVPGHLKHIF